MPWEGGASVCPGQRECCTDNDLRWYIGSRSRQPSRGGAPKRFAAENVLCTILGTPHSHLPPCCEQSTALQAAIHPVCSTISETDTVLW